MTFDDRQVTFQIQFKFPMIWHSVIGEKMIEEDFTEGFFRMPEAIWSISKAFLKDLEGFPLNEIRYGLIPKS